jgi:leader peptidase (prepilin peptidase)/N-methyltransferase
LAGKAANFADLGDSLHPVRVNGRWHAGMGRMTSTAQLWASVRFGAGGRAEMKTMQSGRALATLGGRSAGRAGGTTWRVARAWRAAQPVTRRATLAAMATSVALAVPLAVPLAQRIAVGVAGVIITLAALVDIAETRLPNHLVAAAAVAALAGASATGHLAPPGSALAGAALGLGLVGLVHLSRGVGMGDVKMAGAVGASAGSLTLASAPLAVGVAALVAGTYGVLARRTRLVLGPSLWLGWAAAVGCVALRWWP